MTEFRVTFGVKYRSAPHPAFGKAHPDGWVTIVAPDEDTARKAAVDLLGDHWAFIYDPSALDPAWDEWFPLGELHRFEARA